MPLQNFIPFKPLSDQQCAEYRRFSRLVSVLNSDKFILIFSLVEIRKLLLKERMITFKEKIFNIPGILYPTKLLKIVSDMFHLINGEESHLITPLQSL